MTDIDSRALTLFGVKLRGGIWQVTRDGHFYGHYMTGQPAFEAAEAAARTVVASGGAADIRWNVRPRQAIRAMRTMQFRAGRTVAKG
jgi:hypothetical protein